MNLNTTPFRIENHGAHASAPSHRGPAPLTQHEKLVQQTQKWVGMTFFGPMLKQMRQSPLHSNLLDGGRGGQAFESMYDQRLAEHMAGSASNSLVNSIVRRIEAKQAYSKHQTAYNQQQKSRNSAHLQAAVSLRASAPAHARAHNHGAKHVAPGW
jgi:Rod binding domain-containing protein